VERIYCALEQKEPIAIYGDYDVDGVTATALLVDTLKALARTCEATSPTVSKRATG
jgi:single-stranded-DNA-specific exonuclease